jgi:methionyl aminopeptidase
MITRKSKAEIETMREAGKIVAAVHNACKEAAAPGVSTGELDAIAEDVIRSAGAVPTFLGYNGFPASICASINDEVVHGIPSRKRKLSSGDIFKLDVGATLRGMVADAAITFGIGDIPEEVERLLEATRESLFRGIDAARVGNRIYDISHAVESYVAPLGYGIVRDYGGHGVGHRLHEEPHIPNHGPQGKGPRIKPGYCLAIEPMVNLGGDDVKVLSDRWTVVTADGKWSAHFEHSLAVTDDGPLILTLPDGAPQPFLGGAIL